MKSAKLYLDSAQLTVSCYLFYVTPVNSLSLANPGHIISHLAFPVCKLVLQAPPVNFAWRNSLELCREKNSILLCPLPISLWMKSKPLYPGWKRSLQSDPCLSLQHLLFPPTPPNLCCSPPYQRINHSRVFQFLSPISLISEKDNPSS